VPTIQKFTDIVAAAGKDEVVYARLVRRDLTRLVTAVVEKRGKAQSILNFCIAQRQRGLPITQDNEHQTGCSTWEVRAIDNVLKGLLAVVDQFDSDLSYIEDAYSPAEPGSSPEAESEHSHDDDDEDSDEYLTNEQIREDAASYRRQRRREVASQGSLAQRHQAQLWQQATAQHHHDGARARQDRESDAASEGYSDAGSAHGRDY